MNKIKILFLAAEPSDISRLRIGQELRDIREKLQLSKQRDNFLLESRESVRPGDITQAVFDVEPQVVHFSGHGTSTGELCFEDVSGQTKLIQSEALAKLFSLVAECVTCVILNACYSEVQAKAIAEHIPFVIGMNQAIGDKAAISFATGFYKALGAGRSFEDAYKFALLEIQLEGIPEHLTPVIYVKDKNPYTRTTPDKTAFSDLDFARIAIDSNDLNWTEKSYKHDNSPFKTNCSQYFQLAEPFSGASLSLDITIINIANTPAILTAVGIEIVSVARKLYVYGLPTAAKIYKTDSYEIELPDIYKRLPKTNRFGEVEPISLNEVVFTRLKDPIYLESKAPYRYGLCLKEYRSNIPNHAILRLLILTNLGQAHSKLVEIFTR